MKSFQNQKVLVAGATGFIGSHVMERLRQDYKFPRGEVRAWPDVWAEFKGEAK
jgi:nucleoside-diphosphate-sugar epimerase